MCNFIDYIIAENKDYQKQLGDAKMALALMTGVAIWALNENFKLKRKLKKGSYKEC